jgi:hypothetical protein
MQQFRTITKSFLPALTYQQSTTYNICQPRPLTLKLTDNMQAPDFRAMGGCLASGAMARGA